MPCDHPLRRAALLFLALAAPLVLASCAWFPDKREPAYEMVDSWGGQGSEPGRFNDPNGIAVAGDRVYVADSRNHRIQVFTRDGAFIEQWPVPDDGRPMNLDAGGGRLYAADYWNDVIRVYALQSGELVRSVGGPGDGPGRFHNPGGVAVGPGGHIFVADFANQRVQELTADGAFVRQWGTTGEKGYILGGGFNYPIDVDVAGDGTLFVADGYNDRIQVFGPDGDFVRKWGGPLGINIRGDQFGWFRVPTGIAVGPEGRTVFVADQENNRVQKFTRDGAFLTAFGTSHDGPGYTESAVAVAPDGTLYSVNLIDNKVEIWKPTDATGD